MKRILIILALLLMHPAMAASVGRSSAPIENARPAKTETAWGRLCADALRESAKTDVALVPASVLQKGTLDEGPIEREELGALLAFPDDSVAVMQLSGAQLRAALERAVSAAPTASPAFLQVSGVRARFDANAPAGQRVFGVRVNGAEAGDKTMFSVAMPASLADGGAGYFSIWNGAPANRLKTSLRESLISYISSRGTISPDNAVRFTQM
jgi:hypothetical protein